MRISDWSSDVCSSDLYFDNQIPKKDGEYEDRGGFWAPVELWHRDAEHWKTLYQKSMRVLVEGRTVRDEWRSEEHTSELQSLMRISYAVFCLKKKTKSVETRPQVTTLPGAGVT